MAASLYTSATKLMEETMKDEYRKIIKSGGHCYNGCGWLECDFWHKDDTGSYCKLFGDGVKKYTSEALHICDKIYGRDYEGNP